MVRSSLVSRRLKTISIFNPLDGVPKFSLRKQTINVDLLGKQIKEKCSKGSFFSKDSIDGRD